MSKYTIYGINIIAVIFIALYAVFLILESAFSTPLSNRSIPDAYLSPFYLFFLCIVLQIIFRKYKYYVFFCFLPLLSLPIILFEKRQVAINNKFYQESTLNDNNTEMEEYLKMLPKEAVTEKPEFYLVRLIDNEKGNTTILYALQRPLSRIVDIWGNREQVESTSNVSGGIEFMLARFEYGYLVHLKKSGLISRAGLNPFETSNTGFYRTTNIIEDKNLVKFGLGNKEQIFKITSELKVNIDGQIIDIENLEKFINPK